MIRLLLVALLVAALGVGCSMIPTTTEEALRLICLAKAAQGKPRPWYCTQAPAPPPPVEDVAAPVAEPVLELEDDFRNSPEVVGFFSAPTPLEEE